MYKTIYNNNKISTIAYLRLTDLSRQFTTVIMKVLNLHKRSVHIEKTNLASMVFLLESS